MELQEGFRRDRWRPPSEGQSIPVIHAFAFSDRVFDIFMQLVDVVGEEVAVALQSTHSGSLREFHQPLTTELAILKSRLYDFEDLFLEDGFLGIAVYNFGNEVDLNDHKELIIYSQEPDKLKKFEKVLERNGVNYNPRIIFGSNYHGHIHLSSNECFAKFQRLIQFGCFV